MTMYRWERDRLKQKFFIDTISVSVHFETHDFSTKGCSYC